MDKSWQQIFNDYPSKDELNNLLDYINKERRSKTIFPEESLVFKVFDLPLDKVKVVILGQDPYHNDGEACGLSFSVPEGIPLPKSLINIYKELESDLAIPVAKSGNLESWFKQGVFLLNSVLTVEKNKPGSHSNIGWQNFTDYIIKSISDNCPHVVFILWGNYARSKKNLINSTKHKIIESAHPSPLAAYRGFWGSKPFSSANSYLKNWGLAEIDFRIE